MVSPKQGHSLVCFCYRLCHVEMSSFSLPLNRILEKMQNRGAEVAAFYSQCEREIIWNSDIKKWNGKAFYLWRHTDVCIRSAGVTLNKAMAWVSGAAHLFICILLEKWSNDFNLCACLQVYHRELIRFNSCFRSFNALFCIIIYYLRHRTCVQSFAIRFSFQLAATGSL